MNYVVLFGAVLFTLNPVWAQPCCTGTGPQEFGLLGIEQDGLIGAELATNIAQGSFDRSGRYRTLDAGKSVDVITSLGGAYRIWVPQLQVSAQLPLHTQFRSFTGVQPQVRTGIGDLGLTLRYRLYERELNRRKAVQLSMIDVHSQSVLPTGRSIENASLNALGADVTGEGLIAVGVGVRVVIRFYGGAGVRASAQYQRRMGTFVKLKVGDLVAARWLLDYSLNTRTVVGIGWRYRHVFTPDTSPGDPARHGSRRLRIVGTLVHHLVVPVWALTMRFAWDPPIDGISSNIPFAGGSMVVGLRRVFL